MEAATKSHPARAAATSERWPAWSAPMVGTSPRVRPVARASRQRDCILAGAVQISMVRSGLAGAGVGGCQGRLHFAGQVVALVVVREAVLRHIVTVLFQGVAEEGCAV